MGKIYNLYGSGKRRIDVPANAAKNNLPIGTVLQLVGYSNPRFVVIKNLGINEQFPSHGASYETINIETGERSRKSMLGCDHISLKDNPIKGIHLYFTDTILSADEIMDCIKRAETNDRQVKAKQAAADHAKAAELADINAKYGFLERLGRRRVSTYALGAANIRKELKREFPGIKFSVTSEGYSMGSSITVSWVDAVTPAEVEKVIKKYEYGTFDSMTDCAGSIESQFIDLYGGARHVSAGRRLTDAAYNKTAVRLGYPQAVFNSRTGIFDGVDYGTNEMIKREAWKTRF